MNTNNTTLKPPYCIPVQKNTYHLYCVCDKKNLIVLMCPEFAGTQFYIYPYKKKVEIIVTPLKGLDSNPNLLELWIRVCRMYHAQIG